MRVKVAGHGWYGPPVQARLARLSRPGASRALVILSFPRAYARRRIAEGKSPRDIKRCLKRIIARQLFRLLERYDQPGVEVIAAA
jgi:hypothetical protein